ADLRLEEHRDALCIINSTGFVYHVPQVVYKSSCPIDVYVFPFDIQNCTLKFGSWAYNGKELDLRFFENKEWIDLTEYLESSSWTIVDCPAFRHVAMYSCCPDSPWVDLQYHLIFQRRSTLYNYILILPCILLTSITLILFFIPPESPAKMQLGLAVFIAFFVLLRLLEKNLPPGTSHMPLLVRPQQGNLGFRLSARPGRWSGCSNPPHKYPCRSQGRLDTHCVTKAVNVLSGQHVCFGAVSIGSEPRHHGALVCTMARELALRSAGDPSIADSATGTPV
ncbi:neuronal acetylcholine receptor subunit alpha-7, partial [Plakobranchus ocellatus]